MVGNYVKQVWLLSRKIYGEKFRLEKIAGKILCMERLPIKIQPVFNSQKGKILGFQSHSSRSAWVYKPWKDRGIWYPGIEYKGIGYKGTPIRALGNTAWGGVEKDQAVAEHSFSKLAFDAGVFCQRPLMVYEGPSFMNRPLGVVVRAFTSPLRLSDFQFNKPFLKQYLEIRKENIEEYCCSLGLILGASVRKMFDIGLYHGAMELNNITTEGEIADFEPTTGGTWEGLMQNTEPRYRVLALNRLFLNIQDLLSKQISSFVDVFSNSFFNSKISVSLKNPGKQVIEKYIGRELKEKELKIKIEDKDRIKKAIKALEQANKSMKNKEEIKRINCVLADLRRA